MTLSLIYVFVSLKRAIQHVLQRKCWWMAMWDAAQGACMRPVMLSVRVLTTSSAGMPCDVTSRMPCLCCVLCYVMLCVCVRTTPSAERKSELSVHL